MASISHSPLPSSHSSPHPVLMSYLHNSKCTTFIVCLLSDVYRLSRFYLLTLFYPSLFSHSCFPPDSSIVRYHKMPPKVLILLGEHYFYFSIFIKTFIFFLQTWVFPWLCRNICFSCMNSLLHNFWSAGEWHICPLDMCQVKSVNKMLQGFFKSLSEGDYLHLCSCCCAWEQLLQPFQQLFFLFLVDCCRSWICEESVIRENSFPSGT